jgi:hypothetical protein
MPWVGLAYATIQQKVEMSAPGGRGIYRLLGTCGCGAKFEYMIVEPKELAHALGDIGEHWLTHLHQFPVNSK